MARLGVRGARPADYSVMFRHEFRTQDGQWAISLVGSQYAGQTDGSDPIIEIVGSDSLSDVAMIQQVRVQNFRNLDVDVSLEPITVLVGKSGSGKTNFIESLAFLRDALRQNTFPETNVVPMRAGAPFEIRFHVQFRISDLPGNFEYHAEWSQVQTNRNFNSIHESLRHGETVLFHRSGTKWDIQPPFQQDVPPNHLVLSHLVNLPGARFAKQALADGIACYRFSSSVLSGASKDSPGALRDDAQNAWSVFKDLRANPRWIAGQTRMEETLKRIDRSVVRLDTSLDYSKIVVQHRRSGQEDGVILGLESEGFRRSFAILLALHQPNLPDTMIFEEPENGIHPGALSLLADEMKNAVATRGCQIILTTHSPEFLDQFEPECIRVVTCDDGITHILPIDRSQVEAVQQGLLHPGELLTVDEARPEPVSAGS